MLKQVHTIVISNVIMLPSDGMNGASSNILHRNIDFFDTEAPVKNKVLDDWAWKTR